MTSDFGAPKAGKGSTFFQSGTPASSAGKALIPKANLAGRLKEVSGLELTNLMLAAPADLETVLEELLAALKNKPQSEILAGERHGDGGLGISSQVAVWMVGQVSATYGSKLLKLSKLAEPAKLRSTKGLAELLTASIQDHLGTGTS
jgi:hypothetical protein